MTAGKTKVSMSKDGYAITSRLDDGVEIDPDDLGDDD